jgi:hypothetical protein
MVIHTVLTQEQVDKGEEFDWKINIQLVVNIRMKLYYKHIF